MINLPHTVELCCVQMVEEWVKNKTPIAINQGPSLREKSILLVKLMQYVEKRFSDDTELMAQFLELVNHVYRDETLRNTELTAKLEPAFLAGLRCTQPHIRARFFQVGASVSLCKVEAHELDLTVGLIFSFFVLLSAEG